MNSTPKNASLDGLYMAVGRAISNWAAVEIQLHQIFTVSTTLVIMQPGGGFSVDNTIPSAVLDAIDGFNGKLLMVAAALRAALRDLDSEAADLLNDGLAEIASVRSLHGNRNNLAHWTAMRTFNPKTRKEKAVLAPPSFSSRSHQGVCETDINEWSDNFFEAQARLAKYVSRLASHRGLQHRHLALAASQVVCSLPDDPTALEFLKQQLSGHL